MDLPTNLCPICKKMRIVGNHSKCSRQLQQQHKNDKRPDRLKKLGPHNLEFFNRIDKATK